MANIRIIVADDHKIVRDGVKSLIEDEPGYEIAGEATSGEEAVIICREQSPDVVIMDINMPEMDGINATRGIKEANPDIKILALTMSQDDQHIKKMIEAGASGYILKSSGKDELIKAINTIIEGKHYFSEEATQSILMELVKPEVKKTKQHSDINITDREIEILKLIVEEYTNQEIADELYISVRTVDTHRRNLLQKTGSKNTAGLVKYAIKNSLFDNG